MNWKSLPEVLNFDLFLQKRICIEEVLPQNVNFFIIDISSILNVPISAFNETAEHYRKISSCHKKNIVVKSVYDGELCCQGIVDDVFTASDILGIAVSGWFFVYRANSCKKSDLYNYDMIVSVRPLRSGVSPDIDGGITIFDRKELYLELMYKVLMDRTVYTVIGEENR